MYGGFTCTEMRHNRLAGHSGFVPDHAPCTPKRRSLLIVLSKECQLCYIAGRPTPPYTANHDALAMNHLIWALFSKLFPIFRTYTCLTKEQIIEIIIL